MARAEILAAQIEGKQRMERARRKFHSAANCKQMFDKEDDVDNETQPRHNAQNLILHIRTHTHCSCSFQGLQTQWHETKTVCARCKCFQRRQWARGSANYSAKYAHFCSPRKLYIIRMLCVFIAKPLLSPTVGLDFTSVWPEIQLLSVKDDSKTEHT